MYIYSWIYIYKYMYICICLSPRGQMARVETFDFDGEDRHGVAVVGVARAVHVALPLLRDLDLVQRHL